AEKIGLNFGLSAFLTGVLIVGVGTSLPELISSILATTKGVTEIVIGNVLGSNITNIFLVLGIAGLIGKNFTIKHDLMRVDIPFLLSATLLMSLMILDGSFSMIEGILCLLAFIIYIIFTVMNPVPETKSIGFETSENNKIPTNKKPIIKELTFIIVSSAGIFLGAKYTVDSVIAISSILGIATDIIALTAIALGTSLPEVLVTISASRRGNPEMAVGNIIGSNIFNGLVVMGIPSLIAPLHIPHSIIIFSLPTLIAAVFIYSFMVYDKKINQLEGGTLLIFYFYFVGRILGIMG
ncbi:MAG: sodium:calcium antiporter, partial [Spirochaetes bacterium]